MATKQLGVAASNAADAVKKSELDASTVLVAKGLKTASTVVAVDAATAPTVGQVLTAVNGTTATWQDAPGAGSGLTQQQALAMISMRV